MFKLSCFGVCVACILGAMLILLIDLWNVVDWSAYHYRIFWTCGIIGTGAVLMGVAHGMLVPVEKEPKP